ncbi:Cell division protein FtsX [compost metagenome]
MKLVGATNSFIRWPFFIEGALLGFIGSVIPIIIILVSYWNLMNTNSLDMSLLLIKLKPFSEIQFVLGGLLLGIGMLIGVWGSMISVRKFLRV